MSEYQHDVFAVNSLESTTKMKGKSSGNFRGVRYGETTDATNEEEDCIEVDSGDSDDDKGSPNNSVQVSNKSYIVDDSLVAPIKLGYEERTDRMSDFEYADTSMPKYPCQVSTADVPTGADEFHTGLERRSYPTVLRFGVERVDKQADVYTQGDSVFADELPSIELTPEDKQCHHSVGAQSVAPRPRPARPPTVPDRHIEERTEDSVHRQTENADEEDEDPLKQLIRNLVKTSLDEGKPTTVLFDAAIVYAPQDYDDVMIFLKDLEAMCKHHLKKELKIKLYDSEAFAQSSVRSADDVTKKCSVVFCFLTRHFNTPELMFFVEESIAKSKFDTSSKCVIKPVHTQAKDRRNYSTPAGFLSANSIDWYDRSSSFTRDKTLAVLKEAIKQREKQQTESDTQNDFKHMFNRRKKSNNSPSSSPGYDVQQLVAQAVRLPGLVQAPGHPGNHPVPGAHIQPTAAHTMNYYHRPEEAADLHAMPEKPQRVYDRSHETYLPRDSYMAPRDQSAMHQQYTPSNQLNRQNVADRLADTQYSHHSHEYQFPIPDFMDNISTAAPDCLESLTTPAHSSQDLSSMNNVKHASTSNIDYPTTNLETRTYGSYFGLAPKPNGSINPSDRSGLSSAGEDDLTNLNGVSSPPGHLLVTSDLSTDDVEIDTYNHGAVYRDDESCRDTIATGTRSRQTSRSDLAPAYDSDSDDCGDDQECSDVEGSDFLASLLKQKPDGAVVNIIGSKIVQIGNLNTVQDKKGAGNSHRTIEGSDRSKPVSVVTSDQTFPGKDTISNNIFVGEHVIGAPSNNIVPDDCYESSMKNTGSIRPTRRPRSPTTEQHPSRNVSGVCYNNDFDTETSFSSDCDISSELTWNSVYSRESVNVSNTASYGKDDSITSRTCDKFPQNVSGKANNGDMRTSFSIDGLQSTDSSCSSDAGSVASLVNRCKADTNDATSDSNNSGTDGSSASAVPYGSIATAVPMFKYSSSRASGSKLMSSMFQHHLAAPMYDNHLDMSDNDSDID